MTSWAARVAVDSLALAPDDVGCHVLPMHTSTVRSALILPLLAGSSIACLPEGDIDGLFAAIDESREKFLEAVGLLLVERQQMVELVGIERRRCGLGGAGAG